MSNQICSENVKGCSMKKYVKLHTLQVINYAMTTKIVCTLIILQDLLNLKAFKNSFKTNKTPMTQNFSAYIWRNLHIKHLLWVLTYIYINDISHKIENVTRCWAVVAHTLQRQRQLDLWFQDLPILMLRVPVWPWLHSKTKMNK